MVAAAWLAVIIAVPPPTIVTMFPSIVATDVFELVYVKAPSLLVVGGTRAKGASPNVLAEMAKPVRAVVILFTVSSAEVVVET